MKSTAHLPDTLPGLYLHFPFCLTKCPYCDFYSETDLSLIPAFLEAAAWEMSLYREDFPRFDTVYLGGGTPSLLDIHGMAFLWQKIHENFTTAADGEVTIEVNPGDPDCSYRELREIGFNRINLGVQSFCDSTLLFLGRRHRAQDGRAAIEAAQKAGFENIGVDLIYGTPTEGLDDFLDALARAVPLPLTHLSCYQLTVEKNTPLKARLGRGEFVLPAEEEEVAFFLEISRTLEERGFIHYEISNFARSEAHESRHNRKYWRHVPYLGIGPGAHSFSGNKRWWNPPSLKDYLRMFRQGVKPATQETLDEESLRLEAVYLGLRTKGGIDTDLFSKTYSRGITLENNETLARLITEGLLRREGKIIRPTRRGMALADSLALLL